MSITNRKLFLKLFLITLTASTTVRAEDVKIEFVTPGIVHVVKGQSTKTLVVTLRPQQVEEIGRAHV